MGIWGCLSPSQGRVAWRVTGPGHPRFPRRACRTAVALVLVHGGCGTDPSLAMDMRMRGCPMSVTSRTDVMPTMAPSAMTNSAQCMPSWPNASDKGASMLISW